METTPTGTRPRVGIVILNWRRIDHTLACLASLAQLRYPSIDVIVVDNGDSGRLPKLIQQSFPSTIVVEPKRNLGFAGGSNLGIDVALRRGADYVLLLNDDTEVAPDLLTILVDEAEADPKIGVLGPSIYYFDEPSVIWSAGGDVGRFGEVRHRQVDERNDNPAPVVQDVGYVTGCAMLVRRAVIDRVGVLDERFFAYYEETEWCARARRAGFRIVYVPTGQVWHKITRTQRGATAFYQYLMTRNRLLYLKAGRADAWTLGVALVSILRTAASWRLRKRHRSMRPMVGALLLGVRDFLLGRFGAPPADVAAR